MQNIFVVEKKALTAFFSSVVVMLYMVLNKLIIINNQDCNHLQDYNHQDRNQAKKFLLKSHTQELAQDFRFVKLYFPQ